ncbi:MAG: FDLD family class I lanthipeptide [Acidimicrobiales bacterium]
MHEADSWFDLDVRIDESVRHRPAMSAQTFTSDYFTVGQNLTVPPRQSDEAGRSHC